MKLKSKELTSEQEWQVVKKTKKNKKHFNVLYENYKSRVESYIFNKIGIRSVAEDLTSITFEKALVKIDSFRWQGVSFGCWLFRIARNTLYDHYRTDKKKTSSLKEHLAVADKKSTDFEASLICDEMAIKLYSVISHLSSDDQYLLYYRYFEGMGNKAVSEKVGLSEQNVATRLHRIRKKMKTFFD